MSLTVVELELLKGVLADMAAHLPDRPAEDVQVVIAALNREIAAQELEAYDPPPCPLCDSPPRRSSGRTCVRCGKEGCTFASHWYSNPEWRAITSRPAPDLREFEAAWESLCSASQLPVQFDGNDYQQGRASGMRVAANIVYAAIERARKGATSE